MTLASDLMGVGFSWPAANLEGYGPVVSVTAAGTTATDATLLKPDQDLISLTGTGSDGVKLSSTTPLACPIFISCISGGGIVYPPTSGQLNGGTATTGGITVATAKSAIAVRFSTNAWFFLLSA